MRVSLRKVIWSDFGALLCLLAPVVVLLLACEDRTLGVLGPWLSRNRMQPGEASAFLGMAGTGLAAVSLLLLIARLRTFRLCFAHGVLVPGIITSVPARSDRGRLVYRYRFDDREYQASNLVHRSHAVKRLQPGACVQVVVRADRPGAAFVAELYAA